MMVKEIQDKLKDFIQNHSENVERASNELILENIESKRSYLNNLITIAFVSSGFAIAIKDQLICWSLVFIISLYLLSIIVACIYLTLLLTSEGKGLDKMKKFQKKSVKDMLDYINRGELKDASEFIRKKGVEEEAFRKRNIEDFSDIWFWLVNIFFILATGILLISFLWFINS